MYDLGYVAGHADAAADIRLIGKARAEMVAKALPSNDKFNASYTAGYQAGVSEIETKA